MIKKTPLILNLNDNVKLVDQDKLANDVIMSVSPCSRDTTNDPFADDVVLNMRFDNYPEAIIFFDDCRKSSV